MLLKRRCLLIAFSALLNSSLHCVSSAFGLALLPGTLRQHSSFHRQSRSRRQYIVLHSSNSGNESSDEGASVSKDEDSDNEPNRFGRYWPIFKTASIAFVAGSLSAFILSIILFHQSLDYNPASTYQSADMSKSLLPTPTRTKSLSESSQMQQPVTLYRLIIDILKSSYVDEINTEEMVQTSVESMLSTLDPYTEYLSPKELAKRKNLVGIGAFVMKSGVSSDSVTLDGMSASKLISGIPSAIKLPTQLLEDKDATQKQAFKVVLSLEGYAYDAGLRVGDELISINGQSITGDDASTMPSLEEVRELLLGIPGTTVEVQFTRPGVDGLQTINIKRGVVQFPSVPCATMLQQSKDGSIGYIRLRRFGADAGESMKAAIQSLQSKAPQEVSPTRTQQDNTLAGLVLDLRDNTGGELFEAIKVASLFVPDNTYLGSSKGEGSMMPNQSYYSGKLDLAQADDPVQEPTQQMIDPDKTHVVILTNKQTASASEFLAGVFQDLDLGVIVGNDKETLGKGVGQRELPLPTGALKLTYHEFYTPSGRCVQRQYDQNKSKQSPRRHTNSDEVFYTTNGRKLGDRRGIQADRRFKPSRSDLSELLSSSGAYYKYASQWSAKHPSAKLTDVDEAIYKDFRSFVLKEQQKGNLKLEEIFDDKHILQQMEIISKSSNDRDLSLQSLVKIREEIVKDLLTDFDLSKDIIKRELELNLLTRDLPDRVLIERGAKSDALVKEAVKILLDNNSYDTILNKNAT
eukprot:scaffold12913_cov106-Skeletonema_marinoi.AAC.2